MAEADVKKEMDALKQELVDLKRQLVDLGEASGKAAKQNAEAVKDAAKDAVNAAREKLMAEAEALMAKVKDGAEDIASTVQEKGTKAVGGLEHRIEEKPLTAVLTALGIGFAVGWLSTRGK